MISYIWIVVVGLVCICDGGTIGSEVGNYIHTTSLCDAMSSGKETLSSSLKTVFGLTNVNCAVQDECQSLQCLSVDDMKEGYHLSFRIDLNLCQVNNKTVKFAAEGESIFGKKWSMIMPLFSISHKSGRHKIAFFNQASPLSQTHIFLKVITPVKLQDKEATSLLTSSLQSCEDTQSESSCQSFPLFVLPYLDINVCDHVKTNFPRSRSSRSVAVDLHTRQPNISPTVSSQIDRPCDFSIHFCGKNAACVNHGGKGTCECLEGFVPDMNGTCVNRPVDPPKPANHYKSYSPVLGAIFSIIILLGMAAAAVYGTKHQIFQRLRNRLPVSLRCWPFPVIRRTRAADDNVSLVYPIDDDGDDEPLLL